MRPFKLSFFIPLIAFIGLAAIGWIAIHGVMTGSRNPSQLPSVLVGKSAPDLPLPLLEDLKIELALVNYSGQPFLVNFFASWCAPCRAEAPNLEKLSEQISIIGIAYKDRHSDTAEFLQQYGNPFTVIGMDDDGRAGIAWGVYGVPETYLIDNAGVIRWRHAGPLTRDVINSQLQPLMAKIK